MKEARRDGRASASVLSHCLVHNFDDVVPADKQHRDAEQDRYEKHWHFSLLFQFPNALITLGNFGELHPDELKVSHR